MKNYKNIACTDFKNVNWLCTYIPMTKNRVLYILELKKNASFVAL